MTYGTPYFASLTSAFRYYRSYDYKRDRVRGMIQAGEIHIGRPPLRADETCKLNPVEGRYFVTVAA